VTIVPGQTYPPQRSFKPRRRGLSPSRLASYERAMARWGLAVDGSQLSFAEVFGDAADVVLDVGFGGGEALIELAEVRPQEHVIGVDVHTPGIAAVLGEVQRRGLGNVRVVEGDAVDFLRRIPADSLAGIRVFFPDPWPKQRQRSRRLIRPAVVARFVECLRPGGDLQLATDDADYATRMRVVCDDTPGLTGGFIDRPSWRPVTRFEQRGVDEGRPPIDLSYTVSESSVSASSSALR
jgi:tRNA (guanine-N7-)-methyltransferase